MEKMELQINSTRYQLKTAKTDLETTKNTELDYYNQNNLLGSLIDKKRPNDMRNDNSFSKEITSSNSNQAVFKSSLSSNNFRSATPKGFFKLNFRYCLMCL